MLYRQVRGLVFLPTPTNQHQYTNQQWNPIQSFSRFCASKVGDCFLFGSHNLSIHKQQEDFLGATPSHRQVLVFPYIGAPQFFTPTHQAPHEVSGSASQLCRATDLNAMKWLRGPVNTAMSKRMNSMHGLYLSSARCRKPAKAAHERRQRQKTYEVYQIQ